MNIAKKKNEILTLTDNIRGIKSGGSMLTEKLDETYILTIRKCYDLIYQIYKNSVIKAYNISVYSMQVSSLCIICITLN